MNKRRHYIFKKMDKKTDRQGTESDPCRLRVREQIYQNIVLKNSKNLLKNTHSCVTVNVLKYVRTAFLYNMYVWLLLQNQQLEYCVNQLNTITFDIWYKRAPLNLSGNTFPRPTALSCGRGLLTPVPGPFPVYGSRSNYFFTAPNNEITFSRLLSIKNYLFTTPNNGITISRPPSIKSSNNNSMPCLFLVF